MTTIVTRAGKGAPLTNVEVDANFTNLNNDKLEKTSNLSDLANTATARSNLGLGNVNNTSDANKPISTTQQAALNLKADLAGAAFTGASSVAVNSASAALTVTQTGSGNALVVEDSASPDSTPFVIDQNGNVAIKASTGITGASLTIGGDVATSLADLFSAHAGVGGFATRYFKSRGANVYSHAVVLSEDVLGSLSFSGSDGTNYIQGAEVRAVVDGAPGTGSMPSRLVFSTTAEGASAPNERMRIGSDGGVSIGTTSAAGNGALRVVNTLLTNERLEINSLGTGNRYAYIDLVGDDTYTDYGVRLTRDNTGADAGSQLISRGTGPLYIKTVEAGDVVLATSNVERMRIDSSGNVLLKSATGALGYGTGAGGTVTQATSKSTAVTLNKPTGNITMSNAELAAGASVIFQLTNSLIMTSDTLVISPAWGGVNIDNYRVDVVGCGIGAAKLRVTNIHTASLSEALILNFAVLKGATA